MPAGRGAAGRGAARCAAARRTRRGAARAAATANPRHLTRLPTAAPQALLPELDESRAGVRKRAIQCLASLAAALPPPSLDDLCDSVFGRLEGQALKQEAARTYIQAVGAIRCTAGWSRRAGSLRKGPGAAVDQLIRHCRRLPRPPLRCRACSLLTRSDPPPCPAPHVARAARRWATNLGSTCRGRCPWPSATCAAPSRATRSCASTACRRGGLQGAAGVPALVLGAGRRGPAREQGRGRRRYRPSPPSPLPLPHRPAPRRRSSRLCCARRRTRAPRWATSCLPAWSSCGEGRRGGS